MKILAFVDVHENKSAMKKLIEKSKDVDLLICAGDISVWGSNLSNLIKSFKATNKKLLIIPGNHEDEIELKEICSNFDFVFYLHKRSIKINNYLFFGHGTGGFAKINKDFEKVGERFKKIIKNEKVIFVSHAPPYNTKLDILINDHYGCKSYSDFILQVKPILCVCGHFHENSGVSDKLGKTFVINPGPYGQIIDLEKI